MLAKRLCGLCILLFLISFSALKTTASAEPLPDIKDIRRFAEDVMIGAKPGAHLVKWLSPPSVRLETLIAGPRDAAGKAVPIPAETPEAYYDDLRDHIKSLSAESGLTIRLMPRDIGAGGDIVITIVPRTLMAQVPFPGVPARTLSELLGPGRCFFLIWPGRDWHIQKARIVINSILEDEHINHCLLEELSQSLGLPNDSDRLRPSVFNESARLTRLSDLDRILIRTLYDPAISAGMTLGTFRNTAETVISRNILAAD